MDEDEAVYRESIGEVTYDIPVGAVVDYDPYMPEWSRDIAYAFDLMDNGNYRGPQAVVALQEDGTKIVVLWRSPVDAGDVIEVELSTQNTLSSHILRGKIAEYTEAVEATKVALSLLEDGFTTLNYSY